MIQHEGRFVSKPVCIMWNVVLVYHLHTRVVEYAGSRLSAAAKAAALSMSLSQQTQNSLGNIEGAFARAIAPSTEVFTELVAVEEVVVFL